VPIARRGLVVTAAVILAIAIAVYAAAPYARAASLIVRAASLGGRAEAIADAQAHEVTARPAHAVPTRHGDVPARFYVPDAQPRRTVLVMPGFNSFGIDEPRVAALATDLAGSGFRVMSMALPDLRRFRLTPAATDVIEDAVAWLAAQPDSADPDGKVGVIAVSFTGGLSISAAGREGIRDKVAFVVSLGGHGDLRRVLRYLATGDAPRAGGLEAHAPHDYGVTVILNGLADRGVVPLDQVDALRDAIATYLVASQLTAGDQTEADRMFATAREMTHALPEPSRTYMKYVNDRAVDELGQVLVPHLDQLGADDPALSPELAPPPAAPVYLLHGYDDNIIPAAESLLLADDLRAKGADVQVLISGLITHAQVSASATASDAWKLIRFWKEILRL
jgi:dienelactone hydrolase